jgi:hypothetical protein
MKQASRKKTFLFRAGAVLALILIAAAMFVVGRGHTVYFDNKTLEYEGESYPSVYRMIVRDKDKDVARLNKRERGMATWMGQNFEMAVDVILEKGAEPVTYPIKLKLPYRLDGIVVNLPAMVAGLPEEAWVSEFIPSEPLGSMEEEEDIPAEGDLLPGDI